MQIIHWYFRTNCCLKSPAQDRFILLRSPSMWWNLFFYGSREDFPEFPFQQGVNPSWSLKSSRFYVVIHYHWRVEQITCWQRKRRKKKLGKWCRTSPAPRKIWEVNILRKYNALREGLKHYLVPQHLLYVAYLLHWKLNSKIICSDFFVQSIQEATLKFSFR